MTARIHMIAVAALVIAAAPLIAADPVAYATPTSSSLTSYDPGSGTIQKLTNLGFVLDNPRTLVLSPDGATAYVGGNGISVVSLPSGKLIRTITALPDPETLALNSDGSLLYGINPLGAALYVIDTSSGELVTEVKLANTQADDIVLSPDDSNIYLTTLYGLTVLNAKTYTVTAMIRIEGEYGEVISKDGKTLYVASQNAPYLAYVVDTATNTVRAAIPDGAAGSATSIALSPDNTILYVQGGDVLVEVSTATNTVIGSIGTPGALVSSRLAVSADGKFVFESGTSFPGLLQFDVVAGTVKPIPVGGHVESVGAPSTGASVYLVQTFSTVLTEDPATEQVTQSLGPVPATQELTLSSTGNAVGGVTFTFAHNIVAVEVSLISTATHAVKTVSVPSKSAVYPSALALNQNAGLAFVATSIEPLAIAVINTVTGTLQQTIDVPGIPTTSNAFLAISPDSSTLYAFGFNGTGSLCSISLTQFTQTKCVTTPSSFNGTRELAISADGSKLYLLVAFDEPVDASGLLEYDAKSLTVTRHVSIGLTANYFENSLVFSAGSNSVYIASLNYATNPLTGFVTRIDLGSFLVSASQSLSYSPSDLSVTPDGTEVLVVGSATGTDVFDGASLVPTGSIPGGQEQSIVVAAQ